MMPGMGQYKDALAEVDDRHFDKIAAIIRGMTPMERQNPKIINGSRRARIANGSGVTVMDVNQLLNRFTEAQKQMKQMSGMLGLPGRRKATKSPKNKRKGTKGGGGGRRPAGVGGMGGMPALPPGLDPSALDPASLDGGMQGLPPGFKLPKLDFGKLTRRDKDS
jgi:signal recognition particle subunit SRP54